MTFAPHEPRCQLCGSTWEVAPASEFWGGPFLLTGWYCADCRGRIERVLPPPPDDGDEDDEFFDDDDAE